ncbi:MAG: helix-turn-helix domain-containing protein [bacterium]
MIVGISDTAEDMRSFVRSAKKNQSILIGGEPGTGRKLLAEKIIKKNYSDINNPYVRVCFLENGSSRRIFNDSSCSVFITDSRAIFNEYRKKIDVSIWISPLRERVEDIPLLIEHFKNIYDNVHLGMWNKNRNMKKLLNYWWPFNILELKRVLLSKKGKSMLPYERVKDVIHHSSVSDVISMKLERFWDDIEHNINPGDIYRLFMEASEKELLRSVLARCGGSRKEASDLLNIHRNTLSRKIKKLELDTDD